MKGSLRKGKVIKGPNYDIQTLATFDKAKISELVSEIELLNQRLLNSESYTKVLKDKVKKHMDEHGC